MEIRELHSGQNIFVNGKGFSGIFGTENLR